MAGRQVRNLRSHSRRQAWGVLFECLVVAQVVAQGVLELG
jgi:hypothetical protein